MSVAITIAYSALLLWGLSVGVRQIYQGYRRPKELLNSLFGNRVAIHLFAVHLAVVTADLFIIGPIALHQKDQFLYWGGRIALLTSSLPLAAYLNRNPQSFGTFIGRWVKFRNFFEYALHVIVAAMALSWFHYYILLWWLVAYRYLDVGPRRALQKLYGTPDKLKARPWAPALNWVTIVSIYVLSFLAVYNRQIIFAKVPSGPNVSAHVPGAWETGVIVGVNLALALFEWINIRAYTDTLVAAAQRGGTAPAGAASAVAGSR
jgi:hypothetical protein